MALQNQNNCSHIANIYFLDRIMLCAPSLEKQLMKMQRKIWSESLLQYLIEDRMYTRVFHKWHFAKKKRCNTSTHPSRVYINQIWKNFFPKTSLEGLATWSKKATQGSLFVAKTYFLIIVQPLWIPSGVPRRGCSIFFCPNTLPFFATDTYKLVAQGSLFIWVYSDYLSFSI